MLLEISAVLFALFIVLRLARRWLQRHKVLRAERELKLLAERIDWNRQPPGRQRKPSSSWQFWR